LADGHKETVVLMLPYSSENGGHFKIPQRQGKHLRRLQSELLHITDITLSPV